MHHGDGRVITKHEHGGPTCFGGSPLSTSFFSRRSRWGASRACSLPTCQEEQGRQRSFKTDGSYRGKQGRCLAWEGTVRYERYHRVGTHVHLRASSLPCSGMLVMPCGASLHADMALHADLSRWHELKMEWVLELPL